MTGKVITVVGILLSIGAAYFASMYNNAMDIIQLVFGFVNAPLFATFLLGMFWKRTTGTGAFLGLFGGIAGSAIFHALTIAHEQSDAAGHVINSMKGGYLGASSMFPSEMAQNFWLAVVRLHRLLRLDAGDFAGDQRARSRTTELKGLVYSLTPKIVDQQPAVLLQPGVVGIVLLIVCVILNFIFW